MTVEFKYSKVQFNEHMLGIRLSKCGRAKIVKLNPPTTGATTFDEYLPILDDEILPRYFKLGEAKRAINAHANGQPLPGVGSPNLTTNYERGDTGMGMGAGVRTGPTTTAQEAYEAACAAFKAQARGGTSTPPAPVDSPFTVLGVSDNASLAECKKAYRALAKEYHPDHNNGDDAMFKEVTEAWEGVKLRCVA